MPRFALDIESVPRPVRAQELLETVNHRVVIAHGAMGTTLQEKDLSLEDDFLGLEGCNEILNHTRPDVLADIHDAYFVTGIDLVETNLRRELVQPFRLRHRRPDRRARP